MKMTDTLKAWTDDDRSVTLASLAAEAGVTTTVARSRCDGLMIDHLGNNTPLKPGEASLIRAAVNRDAEGGPTRATRAEAERDVCDRRMHPRDSWTEADWQAEIDRSRRQ